MQMAKCPKCGAVFPNTLRECPTCGYSPFARPDAPSQPPRPAPQAAPAADSAPEGEKKGLPLRLIIIVVAALLVVALVVGGIFFLRSRKNTPPSDPTPQYCADDAHVWADATCTEPKTCTVCGLTEGEPLGHDFADNTCTRCGAHEKMFTFSELACSRHGDSVAFSGAIRNYSEFPAKKIELRLELFDADKNLVTSDTVYILEEDTVAPEESAQWRFMYDESAYTWKYWRVSVTNFILAEAG